MNAKEALHMRYNLIARFDADGSIDMQGIHDSVDNTVAVFEPDNEDTETMVGYVGALNDEDMDPDGFVWTSFLDFITGDI